MSEGELEIERKFERRIGPLPTPLGDWLRRARTEQRMSQGELASRAGLSRSYVGNIERGYGQHPSMKTLDLLAAALGVGRIDLLAAAGVLEPPPGTSESEREKRLVAMYRSLGVEGQATIERFARFLQAEEHRWQQPRLISEPTDGETQHAAQSGPTLFDNEE